MKLFEQYANNSIDVWCVDWERVYLRREDNFMWWRAVNRWNIQYRIYEVGRMLIIVSNTLGCTLCMCCFTLVVVMLAVAVFSSRRIIMETSLGALLCIFNPQWCCVCFCSWKCWRALSFYQCQPSQKVIILVNCIHGRTKNNVWHDWDCFYYLHYIFYLNLTLAGLVSHGQTADPHNLLMLPL